MRRRILPFLLLTLIGGAALSDSPSAVQSKLTSAETELLKRFVAECVLIQPGTEPFPKSFMMGSADNEQNALPPATVEMHRPFRICQYEMTQELYQSLMDRNPSRWQGRRNSVEMLTLSEAEECCRRLTASLQALELIGSDEVVRLPTEAEWEYCCRAGTSTRYSFGDRATSEADVDQQASILNDYAWHTGNAAGNDPAVGSLKPNPWKLYDMHGYLWEYVSEPFESDAEAEPRSSGQPADTCVVRGGSWKDPYPQLTSAARRIVPRGTKDDAVGFRCVISTLPSPP